MTAHAHSLALAEPTIALPDFPIIDDSVLIARGFALGCAGNVEALIGRATVLHPALRSERAAGLAALWATGCGRVMDEGLLADAIARNPELARSLRKTCRAGRQKETSGKPHSDTQGVLSLALSLA